MIRVLDKGNGFVIQKVVHPNGQVIRYQTVPEVRTKGDEVLIYTHTTLAEARERIGKGGLSGNQTKKSIGVRRPKRKWQNALMALGSQ